MSGAQFSTDHDVTPAAEPQSPRQDITNPNPESGPFPDCCCVVPEKVSSIKITNIRFHIAGATSPVAPASRSRTVTTPLPIPVRKCASPTKSPRSVGAPVKKYWLTPKPTAGAKMTEKSEKGSAKVAVGSGSLTGVAAKNSSVVHQTSIEWSDTQSEKTRSSDTKRNPLDRIFVNRGLHLAKIRFYGFDMDYTLAVYKSPLYESIMFDLIVNKLVSIGYPEAIREYKYDATFPVRGLWFDSKYGTLLKMDPYGNILVALKGFNPISGPLLLELYPNKFVQFDESRIHIMNTLFTLPELYLLACIIQYFSEHKEYVHEDHSGVKCGDLFMSYKSILQDVRDAVDFVHIYGTLKETTLTRLPELLERDGRLATLLDRIRSHGGKTFLLTNSKYDYTSRVMGYLLNSIEASGQDRLWSSYFDYIVVDANKPRFFAEGNTLREIDPATGEQKIGVHTGPLKTQHVYSGGSCDVFSNLIGARGKDVLYVGDHIYGDILKSKKIRGWRTFLVVPEITTELVVWTSRRHWYLELEMLEQRLRDSYINMDSTFTEEPDTGEIQEQIRQITHNIDLEYGMFGSLFSSGSRQSFFASQVIRFADLYSNTPVNLIQYPFFFLFKPAQMLMPHQLTVLHEEVKFDEATERRVHMRSRSVAGPPFIPATVTEQVTGGRSRKLSLMAETPKTILHHHDDDSDDTSADNVASNPKHTSNPKHSLVSEPEKSVTHHRDDESDDSAVNVGLRPIPSPPEDSYT